MYTGNSIVDYLSSNNQASDYASRKALAASKGINNYSGTVEQNLQLLNLLRNSNSTPTNINNITPVNNVNIPSTTPNINSIYDANATNAGMNASITANQQYLNDLRIQQEKYSSEMNNASSSILSFLSNRKDPTTIRNELNAQYGINPQQYFIDQKTGLAEISSLNKEYANIKASMDTEISNTIDAMASVGQISRQQAAIERKYAPTLNRIAANVNAKTATLEALQGNFNSAQNFIDKAVESAVADDKYKLDSLTALYDINRDTLNRLDIKYTNALNTAIDLAKSSYETQVKNKETVGSYILKYNSLGAGITINDTPEQAAVKAARVGGDLAVYKKQQQYQQQYSNSNTNNGIYSNFSDIIQKAIDSGASPEEAARAAALVSENQGIQVDQKTLASWITSAKKMKPIAIKQEQPVVSTTNNSKNIVSPSLNFTSGTGVLDLAPTIKSFFSNLFS